VSRIVLATWGSFGDVHPYLAVGIGLKQRGHDVTLATSEFYRSKVEREGLRFHAVRPDIGQWIDDRETIRKANDLRTGTAFLMDRLVMPYLGQSYEDLLEACRCADLFVIHSILFAAPLVAEKLNLKWVSVALAPAALFSAHDPPVIPQLPWLHRLRRFGPLPQALAFKILKLFARRWTKQIEHLRGRAGLPAGSAHPMVEGMFSPHGTLGWFSPLFAAPQLDWPARTRLTGFVFYDKREPGLGLDPALAEFIARGAPPVVFTLGTSAVLDPGGFYLESLDAVRRIGCRAVFLTGPDERHRLHGEIPASVFAAEYAPYSELLPKAAAVVHHGGIGTTAQAMRAGVPMLVAPHAHDQPDNAYRVETLGIARVLARERYSADRVAGHLEALLRQPEYAERAQAIGNGIRNETGLLAACQALEACIMPVA